MLLLETTAHVFYTQYRVYRQHCSSCYSQMSGRCYTTLIRLQLDYNSTSVGLRFNCNSVALQLLDVLRRDRAAALRPK